jgi:light-regulated signal transduction histidine kinase (bacteriophytochrome)
VTSWLFTVTDNGIGVASEFAERIFVIFQRLHGRDMYPGTGIGLAMCRKIIEYHGGRIWLDTSVRSGSRLCFTLPVLLEVGPKND